MADSAIARILIQPREDWRLASVLAFHGCVPALTALLATRHGMALRDGPFRSTGNGVDAIGIGPHRWLLVCYADEAGSVGELTASLAGVAAVSDHSDGYAIFEISGSHARQMLAKGVALDLHPRSFTVSDAAVTSIAHVGATIWQLDTSPRYAIAVFRSYARDFREFLEAAAAEFVHG
jgi:sarcosine oxidase subunit gamma